MNKIEVKKLPQQMPAKHIPQAGIVMFNNDVYIRSQERLIPLAGGPEVALEVNVTLLPPGTVVKITIKGDSNNDGSWRVGPDS